VLTGGEITLHDRFEDILSAVDDTTDLAITLITNGTTVDESTARALASSRVARVCTSLDGIDNATHGAARGKNLKKVTSGLRNLREAGNRVTVISVVHTGNFERVAQLSYWLAEEGLADQHHLCAPSYSGEARKHYDALKLDEPTFELVQSALEDRHDDLLRAGMYSTFNSYWPSTGKIPGQMKTGRVITLQQISEQVKDTLLNIRSSGDVRLQAVTWGRVSVGNVLHGNLRDKPATELIDTADEYLRGSGAGQLRRVDEARHKFQIGQASTGRTDTLIASSREADELVGLVPIDRLDSHWILDNPIDAAEVCSFVGGAADDQLVAFEHFTGVFVLYRKDLSHVLLVKPDEWAEFKAAARAQ
jgi:hypothetical protein